MIPKNLRPPRRIEAYEDACARVGEMPVTVDNSPHPNLEPDLAAVDYRRMGAKWERWARRLARAYGDVAMENNRLRSELEKRKS